MKLIQSIVLICFALLLTCGFYAAFAFFEWQPIQKTDIQLIAQTGPFKEGLKTEYLAEILNLSSDKPRSITKSEAEKLLLEAPCIKEAQVSFLTPETLYIDYTLRTPVFILGDYENLTLDEEGVAFPLDPFYTPKNLPILYLGDDDQKEKREIAFDLLQRLGEDIKFIDVSKSNEKGLGKREIVVGVGKHFLRLNTKTYPKELGHYFKIRKNIEGESVVIDLRIEDLAYIRTKKFKE